MNDQELKKWIHDRIVLSFENDTLKLSRDTIEDHEFCTVQIFRNEGTKEKSEMKEIGGLRFDVALLECDPDYLRWQLHEQSRVLAYEIAGMDLPMRPEDIRWLMNLR